MGQLRKGSIGSSIRVLIKEDGLPMNISSASVKTLLLQKPIGVVVEKVAAFETDGANGWLKYVTIAGDLDTSGPWQGQVYIEMPTGKWHSEMFSFQVGGNLS